jgi:hypothetical protein
MESFENVARLDDEMQARLLDSVLASRGIPHVMVSYMDPTYAGLSPRQPGWGYVEATERYWDEVVSLLDDLKHHSAFCITPPEVPASMQARVSL